MEYEELGKCRCCYGKFCRDGTLIMGWEPIRIIETVKDPGCSPTASDSDELEDIKFDDYLKQGDHSSSANNENPRVFAHSHFLLHDDLIEARAEYDEKCIEVSDYGLEWASEKDDEWADINGYKGFHERKFANLKWVYKCIDDARTSLVGFPNDALWWCMGSWGNLFPVTGHIDNDEYLGGNAGIAARTIALMGHKVYLWITSLPNYCFAYGMPQWIKSSFKLQPIRPTEREYKIPIGQAQVVWGYNINSLKEGDNFAWVLWRLRICCASESSDDEGGGSDTGS